MNKRVAFFVSLTIFTLPQLLWSCQGNWDGPGNLWGDGANWSPNTCGTFPGDVGPADSAGFFNTILNPPPTTVIIARPGPTDLSPLLQEMSITNFAYTFQAPTATSTSTLTFSNTPSIEISNFPVIFDVNVAVNSDLALQMQAGSLTFKRNVTGASGVNVTLTTNGFQSGSVMNNDNGTSSGGTGFVISGTLSINPNATDRGDFMNQNLTVNPTVIGSFLRTQILQIGGVPGVHGYTNSNQTLVNNASSAGAITSVTKKLVLQSSGENLARLKVINLGNISNFASGCQLLINSIEEIGSPSLITLSNEGPISDSFGVLILVTDAVNLSSLLDISNSVNGPIVNAVGVQFGILHGSGSFENVQIRNDALVQNGRGSELTAHGSSFGSLSMINTGNLFVVGQSTLGTLVGELVLVDPITFRGNTLINNTGSIGGSGAIDVAGCLARGSDMTFSGNGSTSTLTNTGTVTIGSGIHLDAGGAFTKSGTGQLNMVNNGIVGTGATGIVLTVLNNTSMSDGIWNVTNNGRVSDLTTSGILLDLRGPFTMSGGQFTLANTGNILNSGIGATVATIGDFTQTGGQVTLIKSQGTVDMTSRGSVLSILGSLLINGGTFTNNEVALLSEDLSIGNSGLVKGEGVFAGITSIPGSPTVFDQCFNAGTIMPGNSPGVLTMYCNRYVQEATGKLVIQIQNASGPGPNGYSQLLVNGEALLNGTLKLIVDPCADLSCDDTFTILQATEGRTGEFANTESCNLPCGFSPVLSYLPTSVLLSFLCQEICPCPCLSDYIGNFTQTLFTSITETNNFFIKRSLQHIQQRIVSEDPKKYLGNVYLGTLGSIGESDARGSQVGFDYWSAGAILASDYAFTQGGIGGLACYENIQSYDEDCDWGSFRTQRAHASLYGTYVPSKVAQLSIDLMVGGGYDWYQIDRQIGTHREAKGKPKGYELDSMLSFEYTFSTKSYQVVPMANLQYAYLHVDSYSEEGAGRNNLHYESQHARSLSSVLGIWLGNTWKWKYTVTAQGNLGWQHEFLNHDRTLNTSAGCLHLEGSERNNLLAGIDLLIKLQERWSLELNYDLIWNKQFDRNSFDIGVNRAF